VRVSTSLSDAREHMWLYHVMPSIKWHCFLMSQLQWGLPDTERTPRYGHRGPSVCQAMLWEVAKASWTPGYGHRGPRVCRAMLWEVAKASWQVAKSYSPMAIVMGGMTGSNRAQAYFFLDWRSLIFSHEWWGHIRCGVLDSLAVCC
jgi:hypothetical protein